MLHNAVSLGSEDRHHSPACVSAGLTAGRPGLQPSEKLGRAASRLPQCVREPCWLVATARLELTPRVLYVLRTVWRNDLVGTLQGYVSFHHHWSLLSVTYTSE